jgi:hypothetical protein
VCVIFSSSGDYSSYSTIPTLPGSLLAEERVILFVGYFETSPIERLDSSGGLLALSCCRLISSAGAVEASGLFFRVNTSRPAKRRRPQLRPPPPDSDASSLPAIFCIIEASGVVSRPASLSVLLVCCLLRGALFTLVRRLQNSAANPMAVSSRPYDLLTIFCDTPNLIRVPKRRIDAFVLYITTVEAGTQRPELV